MQVDDPTSTEKGAGAGGTFAGGKDAKTALNAQAGVVESRPGIIESSNIEPLGTSHRQQDSRGRTGD